MKQVVKNYTFNKTAGTVTFSDFTAIRLDRVLLITDVTNNTVIYQFNESALRGSASTNVLTLAYNTNTSAFNNSDALQIFYDSATGDPTYDTPPLSLNAAQETGGNLATIASNTGSLVTPFMDKAYDYVGMSNADGNGNYQTILFKSGGSSGTTVITLTLTFDTNSNVTSITRT